MLQKKKKKLEYIAYICMIGAYFTLSASLYIE